MSDQKTVTIVCKAKRLGGTKIPLYGKDYHFKPMNPADPESPHVADIPAEDARQIYRLLSIKDGYALLDPEQELPARPAPEHGQTIHNTAPGAAAPVDKPPVIIKAGDEEVNLSEKTREELVEFAKENFDLKVHHKWSPETIIAKIVEATRGED